MESKKTKNKNKKNKTKKQIASNDNIFIEIQLFFSCGNNYVRYRQYTGICNEM